MLGKGNGATGGMKSYAGANSRLAGTVSRGAFIVGSAISLYQSADGFINGDYYQGTQGLLDTGAGAAGTFGGPIGAAFAGGYLAGSVINEFTGASDYIGDAIYWIIK